MRGEIPLHVQVCGTWRYFAQSGKQNPPGVVARPCRTSCTVYGHAPRQERYAEFCSLRLVGFVCHKGIIAQVFNIINTNIKIIASRVADYS